MTGSLLRFPGARGAVTQYVNELSSIYGLGTWIDDPDVALANDPAIYDKLMRDPVIASAIHQRTHSVAGLEWRMEPGGDAPEDKAAAQVMEGLFKRLKKFNQARLELSRAVIVGRTYAYMSGRRPRHGKKVSITGTPAQNWWIPNRMRDVDKRRVRYMPQKEHLGDGNASLTVQPEVWSVSNQRWDKITPEADAALAKLIYQDREDRLGLGEGLGVPVYYYFWAKEVIWKRGLQYLQRWARGMLAAKVNLDRAGDTDKTNEDIADEFLTLFDKMAEGGAFVYGEGEEVSFMEASGTGQDMALNFMKYCDESIYRLLTGSVRPGGMATEGGGARAQAETEQDSSDILIAYDRALLDEAITDGPVRLVWNTNRAQFSAIGLGRAEMPVFASAKERHEDPAVLMPVIVQGLQAGIEFDKQEVYQRIGWKQPEEGAEVFTAPQPAPQPGGGGLPFDAGRGAHFEFDETKVKRDAGKFAPKEGAGKEGDEALLDMMP